MIHSLLKQKWFMVSNPEDCAWDQYPDNFLDNRHTINLPKISAGGYYNSIIHKITSNDQIIQQISILFTEYLVKVMTDPEFTIQLNGNVVNTNYWYGWPKKSFSWATCKYGSFDGKHKYFLNQFF